MMNFGLIPMIVIDSHKAEFWAQIFQDLKLHPDVKLRRGGQIAWAIRKNSPQLKNVLDGFIQSHKKGTLKGNILYKRYLQNTKWVCNVLAEKEFQRFNIRNIDVMEHNIHAGFGAFTLCNFRFTADDSFRVGAVNVHQLIFDLIGTLFSKGQQDRIRSICL